MNQSEALRGDMVLMSADSAQNGSFLHPSGRFESRPRKCRLLEVHHEENRADLLRLSMSHHRVLHLAPAGMAAKSPPQLASGMRASNRLARIILQHRVILTSRLLSSPKRRCLMNLQKHLVFTEVSISNVEDATKVNDGLGKR